MQNKILCILLHRVFHGIRLLRLIKIGCRETINFFCDYFQSFYLFIQDRILGVITFFIKELPTRFYFKWAIMCFLNMYKIYFFFSATKFSLIAEIFSSLSLCFLRSRATTGSGA